MNLRRINMSLDTPVLNTPNILLPAIYSRFYNQEDIQPIQIDDQGILISPQQAKPNLNSHERELDYYNDKFKELMSWAGKPNWDNEGADRVEIKTYKFAMKIVGKIIKKVTYKPEIAPDPDGRIDFNWHLDDGTMFTISVGNKRDLVISGLRYGKSELSGMQVWEIEDKKYSLLECGLDWFNEVQGE